MTGRFASGLPWGRLQAGCSGLDFDPSQPGIVDAIAAGTDHVYLVSAGPVTSIGVYTPGGAYLKAFDGGCCGPHGAAIDGNGLLPVSYSGSQQIRVFRVTGW